MDAFELVEAWGLRSHPEGGYYKETYRSAIAVTPPGWSDARALATAIAYLLPAGVQSAWHRVRGDELWLYQAGAPMLLSFDDDVHRLGPALGADEQLQVLIPGRTWQSATPATGAGVPGWSLVACVVAPGFDFADFELR